MRMIGVVASKRNKNNRFLLFGKVQDYYEYLKHETDPKLKFNGVFKTKTTSESELGGVRNIIEYTTIECDAFGEPFKQDELVLNLNKDEMWRIDQVASDVETKEYASKTLNSFILSVSKVEV